MTIVITGQEAAEKIAARFPEAVVKGENEAVFIKPADLLKVAEFLKNDPDLYFNYLADQTAVDYYEYLEIVYHLISLKRNRSLVLKVRCDDPEKPVAPSVAGVWKGADYMERELFDLMGISFTGHPNLKRIFTWEGFQGYPLRKIYSSGEKRSQKL